MTFDFLNDLNKNLSEKIQDYGETSGLSHYNLTTLASATELVYFEFKLLIDE